MIKQNNNYDQYADEMLNRILQCVTAEIKRTSPRIESATVTNVNNDGTVDVILPREPETEFTRIQNQTPFELREGDSVEIMLKKETLIIAGLWQNMEQQNVLVSMIMG